MKVGTHKTYEIPYPTPLYLTLIHSHCMSTILRVIGRLASKTAFWGLLRNIPHGNRGKSMRRNRRERGRRRNLSILLAPKSKGMEVEGPVPPSVVEIEVYKTGGGSSDSSLLLVFRSRWKWMEEGSSLFLESISWPMRMASSRCQFLGGRRSGPSSTR